jgi:ubiquinone/menaquinone biosynthesis C-methylase UbiE
MSQSQNDEIRESVKQYYSELANQSGSGCGCSPSSCCGGEAPSSQNRANSKRLGYAEKDLDAIPADSNLGLGCGNPTGLASLRPGEHVLDLGSGGGIDCFIAARNVGEKGFVTGVDMSPAMVAKARTNAASGGFRNVEFHLGTIENLPVASNTIDVVISNCVINLSPEKPAVFREIFRVLKPGGRIAVSDIIATSALPPQVRQNDALYCACIGGAVSQAELPAMLTDAGFVQVRITPQEQTRTALRDLLPIAEASMEVVSAYIEAVKPEESGSKEYFDTVADEWDSMRKGFFPDSVREKAIHAANLTPGMTVADIGAGSGFLTEALLKHKVSVLAVDQSARMLDIMKSKFQGTGDVQYREGTAERLPIDAGTMDHAFANMYLHHVDQPHAAVKEMARILKPGGRLVLTDLDEHKFEFLRTEQHDRWMGFRRGDVVKWFEDAGLRNVSVDCVGDNCCATSACGCDEASVSIFIAVGTK